MTNFAHWLDTFVDEKGLDREHLIEADGPSGTNIIPLDVLLAHFKRATPGDQAGIKAAVVRIDFMNGDILHFFRHVAGAIAI